jgi:DNA-binding IclR family transcriptional regulator
MATAPLEAGKTKIARRVIEVFEFFAAENRRATVMDIVRRYGRPQSSTSELLGALVEMGLLYKDARTRSYAPTPRMAALGLAAQPEPVAGGRLFGFMDRLAQSSRCGVGLFGMVGTHAQVFRWSNGAGADSAAPGHALGPVLGCGDSAPLAGGVIGMLLLSTLGQAQAGRMLWRIHAEATEAERFNLAEHNQQVAAFAQAAHATGSSGFADGTRAVAMLLPETVGERRLALGVVWRDGAAIDAEALLVTLQHGVAQSLSEGEGEQPASFLRSIAAV